MRKPHLFEELEPEGVAEPREEQAVVRLLERDLHLDGEDDGARLAEAVEDFRARHPRAQDLLGGSGRRSRFGDTLTRYRACHARGTEMQQSEYQ